MAKLQKPEFIYFERQIRPWDDAKIHVSAEAVFRGLNCFEGLKAYWQNDGSMGVVSLQRHYERFKRSAKLLRMPFDYSWEEFEDAVHGIIKALCRPENNIWVRATLYMMEGHWGEDQRTDLCLQAFQTSTDRPEPITIGVSTWKRAEDNMLPPRIKTSSNYQVARMAKIEGRERGFSEMVILNSKDRVAETGGSCVLIVRDGVVATPPASEGVLESITVDLVEALARERGIPFERRPIDRTELHIAEEIALAGTLSELTPVSAVDDYPVEGNSRILSDLTDAYFEMVTEGHPMAGLSCRNYQDESDT
ncbi:MAG: aminotransferase class IV [Xanthomonadales bacterium]|nr:aminotransferase class IV [Xanthomonadales bacterium]